MNISPPRATEDRNVDSVPNVNARMRKSERLNIGCAERRSTPANTTRRVTAPASRTRTFVLPQPVAAPPDGRIP